MLMLTLRFRDEGTTTTNDDTKSNFRKKLHFIFSGLEGGLYGIVTYCNFRYQTIISSKKWWEVSAATGIFTISLRIDPL